MGPETRCRRRPSGLITAALERMHEQLRQRVAQALLSMLALTLGVGVAVAAAGPRADLRAATLPSVSIPTLPVPPPPTIPGVGGPPAPGSPPPSRGVGPLPPLGPYVHFARVTYTGSPSPNDSKLQILITQAEYGVKGYVAKLHKQNPRLKVLAYQSFWLRPGADPAGETACLPGRGSYPVDWYMFGLAGRREQWKWPTGPVYMMDFANRAYLQACAQHAIAVARSIGADGVFFDGLATSVFWDQLTTACSGARASAVSPHKKKHKARRKKKGRRHGRVRSASAICRSDANWQNAMTNALGYLAGRLHSQHLLLMGNIVGGNVTFVGGGGPSVWQRYDSVMDGAMEEAWAYGTNGRPVPAQRLQAGLDNVAWSEAHKKYSILNDDITHCPDCSGYGMAALLLVGQKLSSYDISNGAYNNYDAWWSQYYDKGRTLGSALGNYYTQSNGLMVRRFVNGTVVVNDTTHAITDPLFGRVKPTSAIIH